MHAPETSNLVRFSSLTGMSLGIAAAARSVLSYVLLGTYVGIGALAHDLDFSIGWIVISTLLMWAAPAQVILLSTLSSGSALIEGAAAVSVSAVRLLPMVVSLLPLLKGPQVRAWQLITPAHFTAISVWVESLRLLPGMPREQRIGFCNGLGIGFLMFAVTGCVLGFYLAASLPALFAAALLFLTPISFLTSVARNSRILSDRLALAFGLIVAPALAYAKIELDLLWTGLIAGTLAYAIQRYRRAAR
jgi:predicted branched-subunit amino acid permease